MEDEAATPDLPSDQRPTQLGLTWTDLSPEQLEELSAEADPEAKVRLLAQALQVAHYGENPRSELLVDLCLSNLTFAEEAGLSATKTSTLFSIVKRVFEHAFEGGNVVTLPQSLEFFKEKVLEHSVDDPPQRAAVFELDDVRLITDFFGKTFFRHFKAYRYVFLHRQRVERRTKQLFVESPLTPPPLDSMTPVEDAAPAEPMTAEAK